MTIKLLTIACALLGLGHVFASTAEGIAIMAVALAFGLVDVCLEVSR